MQVKQHLLDKRVVKRALQEGLIDKNAYQRTLDELPDLSNRVQSSQDSEPAGVAVQHEAVPPTAAHEAAPSGTTTSPANSY